MSGNPSQSELEAYLDEALPAVDMARVEHALRHDPAVARQLAAISTRRDAGLHSLAAIWRRHRLSCPTRSQLGSLLLGTLPDDEARAVRFHLEVTGCRCCQASAADLANQQGEASTVAASRRRRYFESSAGYLRRG